MADFAGVGRAGGAAGNGEADGPAPATRTWTRAAAAPAGPVPVLADRARARPPDLAIAGSCGAGPGLEIDWLAQDPVTRVLEAEGERIHPASAWLANESTHIERESAEHDLHAFQAIRRMDEILVANFMVFHDVVREQAYDLWVGDEAWELDYSLHENPEEKRVAYVWLTDFVGWLPMPDGGEREAFLTADYNAEMIEHIARFRGCGPCSSATPTTSCPTGSAPAAADPGVGRGPLRLRRVRHRVRPGRPRRPRRAAPAPRLPARRTGLRRHGRRVGVGGHLLRRVIDAYPEARRQVPGLRMVVAGPRIDPASSPPTTGWRSTPTSTTCTSTWPPATWPWSRAASPPAWS